MKPTDWVTLISATAGVVAGFAGAFATDKPGLRSKLIAFGIALIVLAVGVALFAPREGGEGSNISPTTSNYPDNGSTISNDQNGSSPLPSEPPSDPEPAIAYDNEYLLGSLDLDADPPNRGGVTTSDLYSNWGDIGGGNSSYANWEDSKTPPTFGQCADLMTRMSIKFHAYMEPKVGNSFCFRTSGNRMAWISILKITKDGILLRVVVWEEPS